MQITATKVQTQVTKKCGLEELKVWSLELTILTTPSYFNNFKSPANAWWEKKKNCHQNDQQDQQGQKSSISATGINIAKPGEANKNKKIDKNQNCSTARDFT